MNNSSNYKEVTIAHVEKIYPGDTFAFNDGIFKFHTFHFLEMMGEFAVFFDSTDYQYFRMTIEEMMKLAISPVSNRDGENCLQYLETLPDSVYKALKDAYDLIGDKKVISIRDPWKRE